MVSQFHVNTTKATFGCNEVHIKVHKHTLYYGISYETKNQLQVHGYTDANYVGNVLDKRSTSGFMFSFGSGAISWSNKK